MPDPHVDGGTGVKTIIYNMKKYSKGRTEKKKKIRKRKEKERVER